MNKQILRDVLGWGVGLWLIGYLLGIALFPIVPNSLLGWVIMPVGVLITLWVLFRQIHATSFSYYFLLAVLWTLIATVGDYIFLVVVFHPIGYYKPDVYIYYLLTFLLPLIIGWIKSANV